MVVLWYYFLLMSIICSYIVFCSSGIAFETLHYIRQLQFENRSSFVMLLYILQIRDRIMELLSRYYILYLSYMMELLFEYCITFCNYSWNCGAWYAIYHTYRHWNYNGLWWRLGLVSSDQANPSKWNLAGPTSLRIPHQMSHLSTPL